ncbi:MAG: sulfotransferase [Actinomycetota bacterium]|nr:sulfotransferase [Actinomycetota bacterium]
MIGDPFFICGNDRSGTTMLRLILDNGPEVAIPPESMFLTDFDANEVPGPQMMERVWTHPKVKLWDLGGGPPALPAGLDAQEARRFIFAAPFWAYAVKHGKPRWGDKTPHYVHHVDRLLDIWPQARFVVLVRDGRDVALSLKKMPFGPNNAWAAAQWWARGIRAGQAAAQAHPAQVKQFRYEDLVEDPERGVRSVCEFLGLRFDPRMLALEAADPAKIVPDQRSWFPGLFDGVHHRAAGRWRHDMTPRDQAIFASLADAELQELGYEVTPTRAPSLSDRQVRRLHLHNEFMRNVNFLKLRLVQERGREFRFALQRRLQDSTRRSAK